MLAVGIDLGTVGARIAVTRDNRAELLEITTNSHELPAVVSYAAGKPQVGQQALARGVTNPNATIRGVKRFLGRTVDDPSLLRLMKHAGFSISPGSGNALRLKLGKEDFPPAEVAAELLGQLAGLARSRYRKEIGFAVLSVPPAFSERQIEALKWAAFQAGLREVAVVPDPVATVASLERPGPRRLVIVVDVGGAYTTASVLLTGVGRETQLLESESELMGGEDVDEVLVGIAAEQAGMPVKDPSMFELLRQPCSSVKRDLCAASTATVQLPPLPFVQGDGTLRFESRHLRTALKDLLRTLRITCIRVRNATSGGPAVLGESFLVGGLSAIPDVREAVAGALEARIKTNLSRTGSVALGAARLAQYYLENPEQRPAAEAKDRPKAATPPPARPAAPAAAARPEPSPSKSPERPSVGSKPQASPDTFLTSSSPVSFQSRTEVERREAGPSPAPSPSPASEPEAPRRSSPPVAPPPEPPRPPIRPEVPPPPEQPQAPPARPSQPPPEGTVADVGQKASMPWTGSERSQAAAPLLKDGRFRNPTSAVELAKMPLTRPLTPADLDPILLPVLLARLGLGLRFCGTLHLEREGEKPIRVPMDEGEAQVTSSERTVLLTAFHWDGGTFRLKERMEQASDKAGSFRMLPIIIEGLRNVMRAYDTDEMTKALGDKLGQAPYIPPRQLRYVGVLGLSPLETRLIRFGIDGKRSAYELIEHGGIGKRTAAGVLLLMSVLDMMKWQKAEEKKKQSIADELKERAADIPNQDMFQWLSIHWTASREDIETAYQKLVKELSPGTYSAQVAPEACRKILEKAEEARDYLVDDRNRVAYRMKTHPDHDYDSIAEFLQQKARAVSMHADTRPLDKVQRQLGEIQTTRKKMGRKRRITKFPDSE